MDVGAKTTYHVCMSATHEADKIFEGCVRHEGLNKPLVQCVLSEKPRKEIPSNM